MKRLLLALVFVIGCYKSQPPVEQTPQLPAVTKPTLTERSIAPVEFNGKTWDDGRVAQPAETGRFTGLVEGEVYERFPDRLVCVRSLPLSDGKNSAGWKQIRVEQRNVADNWIKHGLEEIVQHDGGRIVSTYVVGEEEDVERVFYPDGQLKRETQYSHGKRNGKGVGYWPNGNKQFEAVYRNDTEIEGHGWKEDGTPR